MIGRFGCWEIAILSPPFLNSNEMKFFAVLRGGNTANYTASLDGDVGRDELLV